MLPDYNNVRTIKTWRVFDWVPDDAGWLEQQGIRYRVATNNIPVAVGNSVTYVRGDMGLSVETDTPEQELMLKLKFEPGLVLMLEEIVLPGMSNLCTLSEIGYG